MKNSGDGKDLPRREENPQEFRQPFPALSCRGSICSWWIYGPRSAPPDKAAREAKKPIVMLIVLS